MFRKMPFILVAILLAIVLLDPFLPLLVKQGLYSISLSIKAVIVLLLPFVIFGLLFKAAVTLSKGATKIIGMILMLVCCSNFISTWLSHYIGILIYHFDMSMIVPKKTNGFIALWSLKLPPLLANDKAMFAGLALGIVASLVQPNASQAIAHKIEQFINQLLKGFVYIIPLFVAGFVVKLQEDGLIIMILKDYSAIFLLIAIAQFSYIAFVYLVLNNGRVKKCLHDIKNMTPAAISGFSTMSSAASMPLTIIGAEMNSSNKAIARTVVPLTVNIHLIGDCFAIPIFAYAVLKSFGMQEPSLLHYLTFVFYFIFAKFSVAAIPGGGIIVMLPILESHLGFNAEMMSLITALYILFDPVITCANVLGNGAFSKLIDRLVAPASDVQLAHERGQKIPPLT